MGWGGAQTFQLGFLLCAVYHTVTFTITEQKKNRKVWFKTAFSYVFIKSHCWFFLNVKHQRGSSRTLCRLHRVKLLNFGCRFLSLHSDFWSSLDDRYEGVMTQAPCFVSHLNSSLSFCRLMVSFNMFCRLERFVCVYPCGWSLLKRPVVYSDSEIRLLIYVKKLGHKHILAAEVPRWRIAAPLQTQVELYSMHVQAWLDVTWKICYTVCLSARTKMMELHLFNV